MSNPSDIVAALYKAANQIEQLSRPEKADLLGRASATMRSIYDKAALSQRAFNDPSGVIAQMELCIDQLDHLPDELLIKVFLNAAELIRQLKLAISLAEDS